MAYTVIHQSIGTPPIVSLQSIDTVEKLQPGLIVSAVDPYWGGGEFQYVKAGGTIPAFGACVVLPTFNATTLKWEFIATAVPNTANLGRSAYVAQAAATVGQFFWVMLSGVSPVSCSASVTANTTVGITGTGQLGANTAGKQVLNAWCAGAATTTVVKANASGLAGATKIDVPNTDGLFVGAYLSGTGVGASATISSIDPGGRFIVASVANSALIAGSVTATYNGGGIFYNVIHMNRPFYQGAIT